MLSSSNAYRGVERNVNPPKPFPYNMGESEYRDKGGEGLLNRLALDVTFWNCF